MEERPFVRFASRVGAALQALDALLPLVPPLDDGVPPLAGGLEPPVFPLPPESFLAVSFFVESVAAGVAGVVLVVLEVAGVEVDAASFFDEP